MVNIKSLLGTMLFAFLSPSHAVSHAVEFDAKVIRVADGNTLTVLIDCAKLEMPVRLAGIDAPEKSQDFGQVSKKSLSELTFGKLVKIDWSKKDKYGRLVAKVYAEGVDVSLEQTRRGLAWHFKEYQDEQSAEDRDIYAKAEVEASTNRV